VAAKLGMFFELQNIHKKTLSLSVQI
jgi:hypothetical protein